MIAHASLNRETINVDLAAKLLQDVIPSSEARTLSVDTISRTVASYYHISMEEMKGKRRDKHIVFPRQVAMYLIREETASSLPAIGQAFGGRDHTTVLHSYEKISTESREDQRLQSDLRKIREMLYSHLCLWRSGRDGRGDCARRRDRCTTLSRMHNLSGL